MPPLKQIHLSDRLFLLLIFLMCLYLNLSSCLLALFAKPHYGQRPIALLSPVEESFCAALGILVLPLESLFRNFWDPFPLGT